MARGNSHKEFKEKVKSKITLKFSGKCQVCHKQGIIKIVAGCYSRAYEKEKNWNNKNIPFEIHHIIHVSKGGKHNEENLILVCRRCHRGVLHKKGNNLWHEKE